MWRRNGIKCSTWNNAKMATSPVNVNRLFDGGKRFFLGVNSNLHPSDLNPAQISWGVNVVNTSGILSTRPGYNDLYRLPDGKAQGFTLFTPTGGEITQVSAVSGKIYISQFPFETFMQLTDIQFDPFVDHIFFKEATQGVDNGTVVDPRSVLIMQDGVTRPAFWDGQTSRHLNPGGGTNETIIGTTMEWIGSRLWVAQGRQIFASDIFDPLHFTETLYLSGGGSLQAMDGDVITLLKRTADSRALLAFTIGNTTIIRANITDRSQWQTIPDFISLQFPGVGAVGGKAFCEKNGELWWFSVEGVRRFTQTGEAIRTSRSGVASIEMVRSFRNLSPVLNRVCGFSGDIFLGFSVPSGDVFNRHTWALGTSIADQLTSASPPGWQGIWMGTRPVEWGTGTIMGKSRTFYISQDPCGIRVWEALLPNKEDNGTRIFCSVEGGGLVFQEDLSFKRFRFTEAHLHGVSGTVDFTIEYKGDWGCWKQVASFTMCAVDCIPALKCGQPNPQVYPQNRYVKSVDAPHACLSGEGRPENIGTYFQNRFRWYGKNGIRMYRSQADQYQENSLGACEASDVICKELLCCDQEVNYVSSVNDGYGYGSSGDNTICSI